MNADEIFKQWMAAVNGHDVMALAALMAADFAFIDSLGNRVAAPNPMEAGWRGYFRHVSGLLDPADHHDG